MLRKSWRSGCLLECPSRLAFLFLTLSFLLFSPSNRFCQVKADYALGKTKVFMKNQVENALEAERGRTVVKSIVTIQKTVKMHLVHTKYLKKKKAVIEMQKVGRGFLARKHYKQNTKRVITLQSAIRGHLQRKRYKKMIQAEKERKRREEEEARRRAEEARKKAEEAKRKAEEEERKRKDLERIKKEQAEAEAKAKAESESLVKIKADSDRKAKQKQIEEAEAKVKRMAEEAAVAEKAVVEAKVAEAKAAKEAAEAAVQTQTQGQQKKTIIFLARKDIDDLMSYIEKIPLHTVAFSSIHPFMGTAMDIPFLKAGELTNDDPAFQGVLEVLNALDSPFSQQIVKALGSSIESNTFEKFAKVFFADEATPFYQREPIRHALLAAISHDAAMSAKAVKIFYVLNYYIDHADELSDTLVLRIINYLIEQVGPFPAMHDEVISQMCKQTLKNPDTAKTTRAWRILSIIIGIIPPSVKLLPAFLNYIVEHGTPDLLARLQYRLWRCSTTGPRTKRLTSIEFEALKRRVPVILQAEFADETSVNFEVDTATTTRDILKVLVKGKNISSSAGYSLCAVFKDKEIHFAPGDKVLDVVSGVEALAGAAVPPEDPTKKPTTKEFTDGDTQVLQDFIQTEKEPHQIPETEQVLVRAMFDYKPNKPGDLPLQRNELIILYEKVSPEWWKGKSKTSGKYGHFPALYVTEITEEATLSSAPSSSSQKHTVVGSVDDQLFKRKSMALKDLQAMTTSGSNYVVEQMEDSKQRITITIDKSGKELAIVLRASKKRGTVVSRVDPGGLGMLSGIKEDDQLISIDDRSIEGMKFEKVLQAVRNSGTKIKLIIIRRNASSASAAAAAIGAAPADAARPPPPKAPPPAPPRSTSLWTKAGDYAYPWKLVVKKDFVDPLTKFDDANDVALVTAQVLASEKGKAEKSKFKQLKAANNLNEIFDIALDWPLYFQRSFPCSEPKTKATEIAVDYLGVYLLRGKDTAKFTDFDSAEVVSSTAEKVILKLEGETYELSSVAGTTVGDFLTKHMKDLLQVARYAIALREHAVKDFNMLAFKQGDIIEIVDRADSDDWVLGSFGDKTGWVPAEYLRLLYGKPSAFKGKDKLKESEKAKADAKQHAATAVAPANQGEFDKAVEACFVAYAKVHFRSDDGSDSRSFSTGTMKGTLKKFASTGSMKITKLPEHMLQAKDKDPAAIENEMAEKILFTTEAIKGPLHKFVTSEKDTKASLECFSLIMSYMGDYPSKKARDTLVQGVVSVALKSSTLYDEIYCQILKQLTKNDSEKMSSVKRGWDLLAICLGCFPPTNILAPVLSEFVELHKNNTSYLYHGSAKECFDRLERSKTRVEAFRVSPPSLAEVLAIEMGTPMSVTVSFPGNVTRTVKVDSFTTVADVVGRIAGKVQSINAEQYGLFIYSGSRSTSGEGIPVSNKSSILDVLTHAEGIVKEFKSALQDGKEKEKEKEKEKDKEKDKDKDKKSKSKTALAGLGMASEAEGTPVASSGGSTFTLVCRKKIWTAEDQILESDFVTNILYAQVMEDFLNGNLISMTELTTEFAEVCAQLAALQMKCATASDHFVISQLVPQVIYQRKDDAWWRGKVNSLFTALKDQPEIIFKRQILTILQGLPLFGSTTYSCQKSPDPRLPNGAVICFNINGIHVLDRITKLPVLSCGYNALIEYRYDNTEFVMHTGDLQNKSRLVFHSKQGVQICNTLDTAIDYLVKKRKEEKAREKLTGEASARPSLKKYSPW